MKKNLCYILALACLLLCLTGCKRTPQPQPTDSQTNATQNPTTGVSDTTPTQQQTEPTQPTVPVVPTNPTDPTESTEETGPVSTCEHVLENWIVDKSSTCTSEGTRHRSCTLCGETVETEAIPPVNHSPGSWIIDKKSTCSAEGVRHQECTQCRTKVITIHMAKAAHNEYTIPGQSATATATGLTDGKRCRICGEITQPQYVIPVLGSGNFGYHVNSDDTTCTIVCLGTEDISVSIPAMIAGYKVTGIGNYAFENCPSITTVYIPSSVTQIGQRAFYGCRSLSSISYQGTISQWGAITKGLEWNSNTGNFTVQCTNGNVTK